MRTPVALLLAIDEEIHTLATSYLLPGQQDPWRSRNPLVLLARAVGWGMFLLAGLAFLAGSVGLMLVLVRLGVDLAGG